MSLKKKIDKPKLEIKTRSPQKKGLFDNLGTDRDKSAHPITEILNLPNLDDQTVLKFGRPKTDNLGDQRNKFGRPNTNNLDDKTTKNTVWTTKENTDLDDKTTKEINLDDQKNKNKSNWSKYEKARATDRIGLRPNAEILRNFKKYCVDKGLTMTEFFEISGSYFINSDDQIVKSLDDKTTYDDRRLMINWKTKVSIINLYLRYNSIFNQKTKWTANDDEKAHRLNDISLKIIELGFIQTQFQKGFKGKINSFSYYLNEIDNFNELKMSEDVLDTMLKINRQRWQQTTKTTLNYEEFEK